jgi:hypothetical protein
MTSRFLLGLAASIFLFCSGCKEAETSGGTSGAALYAYDSTTSTVFVWTDLGALYDSTASTVAPAKQITSTVFGDKISSLDKIINLAWGGLCFDRQRGNLYLVSNTGNIVRVNNIRAQSGAVPSTDVVSFSLSSTGRLATSIFGQAALDSQNDTLYITENGTGGTQIWVVANASSQAQSASITLQSLKADGDTGGTGVAAASGSVYAFMLSGDTVAGVDTYSGPRLRKGTASAFTNATTLIGDKTLLGQYGSLALDTGNNYLFLARHNTDAGAATAPIQVFTVGQFGNGNNQAPTKTLGSTTAQSDLRVLAHAGTKDWLVGLRGNGTTAYEKILVWKAPMGGTDAKIITVSPATSTFKGLVVDGNAS